MSNTDFLEYTSILKNFENSMDIKPFELEEAQTSSLGDFNKVELSFENDELSFENDDCSSEDINQVNTVSDSIDNIEDKPAEEFTLIISTEDSNNVIKWLKNVKHSTNNDKIKQACDTLVFNVKKKNITYEDLYRKLERIKDAYNAE